MDNCIFCKIVAGEIPSTKVYEDETVFVFLDIRPVSPGHTLVIPKKHFENFAAAPDEVLAKLMSAAKKIGLAVMSGTNASGFNLSTANGTAAGQEVMHLHFHIIPRKDRLEHQPWKQGEYPDREAQNVAAAIREKL